MKDYDKLTEANELGKIATEKIEIMENVLDYFVEKLEKNPKSIVRNYKSIFKVYLMIC